MMKMIIGIAIVFMVTIAVSSIVMSSESEQSTETCSMCENVSPVDNDNAITDHRHAPPNTKPPRKCYVVFGQRICV